MKQQSFDFELITPCFCGGAHPEQQAEIRPSSIRGQLRWWFRVLGGFTLPLTETEIFGSAAGEEGTSGLLRLQLAAPVISGLDDRYNAEDLGAGMNSDLGYALFPLRPMGERDGTRGTLKEDTAFRLILTWRGHPRHWDNIVSLLVVWANLGTMGFRSRRAVGAIRLNTRSQTLSAALSAFHQPLDVRSIPCGVSGNWRTPSEALLRWYRSWRQHGQMSRSWDKRNQRWNWISESQKAKNRASKGFLWARRDHNEGLSAQGTPPPNPDSEKPKGQPGTTYRPALGLPIIQFFSSLGGKDGQIPRKRATVDWEYGRGNQNEPKGRFASPVLLRPHKDAANHWRALVIFVDAKQWPSGKPVFLNGQPRAVSLDLYEAMKNDPLLSTFPG